MLHFRCKMRRNGCPLNGRRRIGCLNRFHRSVDELLIIGSMALLDDEIIKCAEIIERLSNMRVNGERSSLLRGGLGQNTVLKLLTVRWEHLGRPRSWSHTLIDHNISPSQILLLLSVARGERELIS